ncbi:unnamed protein product [Dovyalis caffra]|uniref:Cupin type-2 domain-containing protein n=1 Tax=Dovyalis caffra TaxID=77055 RepID=A0AAV1SQF9_9ROSI|nr:unnamed protein product [Dovyalis caffra]
MQTPSLPSLFLLLLLSLSSHFFKIALSDDGGFCSAPSAFKTEAASSKPLYWKVTNPTLSPSHLQDLPGFTRSAYKSDHALITPESHVDSYAYLPPNFKHSLECDAAATLAVFERRYASLENHATEQIVGSTDQQPLLETPGEAFELRKLLPPSLPYDFNIHIMDFQPGEFLNVKEVHYNQHGLLLLEGQGIYRLGDSWYPVQSGDAIWMAPFVPQWYAALGKTRTRYLLYKDVNRNPL